MAWTVLGGPVMSTQASDSTLKLMLLILIVITLADAALKLARRVRPAPGKHLPI